MPPPDPTPPPPSSSLASQQFCLRWNNHQSNLLAVFDQLLQTEALVDVTLAVEGVCLKAHKIVLSACSPYFQILFAHTPDKHPIVFLKDVSYLDLKALLDFMYRGEVSVSEDNLNNFLRVAESLRIKGLAEVNSERRLGEVVLPPPPSSIPSPSSAHPPVHSTSLLHSSSLIIPLAPVMSPPPNPPVAHQQPSSRDPHRSGSSSNTLRRSSSSCFMIPPPYLTPKRKRGRPRRVGSTDGMLGKHISTRRGGGRGTMIRTRASFSEEVSENSEGNMMHSPSSASCSSTIKTEPDQPGVSGESPKQKESESKSADGVEGRESVTSARSIPGGKDDDPEQLQEMSVRGLDLFRYASITGGVFTCNECEKAHINKTFKNKYSFQRHAFLYHEGNMRKVFPCPVCAKEFSRPDKMKNHLKTIHDCVMPKELVMPGGYYFGSV